MAYFTNHKWYKTGFYILLVINIIGMTTLWLLKPRHAPPHVLIENFLQNELDLSETQKAKLAELRTDFRASSNKHFKAIKKTRSQLMANISSETFDTTKNDDLLNKLATLHFQHETRVFSQFRQLKDMCTSEQKEKLNVILNKIVKMGARKGPPRH